MMEQLLQIHVGIFLSFFNGRPTAVKKTRKRPVAISVDIHGAPDLACARLSGSIVGTY